MRKASMILGLCGGAAGIIVHMAILGHLIVHGDQSSGDLARLVIAVTLGITAVAASLASRRSLKAATVFLIALGFLGLFPRPLTWIPAACLLLAAGGSALYSLRRSILTPEEIPGPPIIAQSDGAPLHWSEVARLLRPGVTAPPPPVQTPAQASAQIHMAAPAQRAVLAPELLPVSSDEETAWSLRRKGLAVAAVAAAAAVVIPLSLWLPDSVAEASEPARLATSTSTDPLSPPAAIAPDSAFPDEAEEPASTTTTLAPTATVPPFEPDQATWYSNLQYSLTLAVPNGWMEVDCTALADHADDTYHVATFAQVSGPTHMEAYLNGIDIDIMFDARIDEYSFPLLEQALQQTIAEGPEEYDYFQVLEPMHEVEIGGIAGLSTTVRVTWEERVMVQRVYVCTANHCLYQIGFQTDDADWADCERLFRDVVDTISFGPQEAKI